MNSRAKFYFNLKCGSPLVLTYQLQENSLKDRWCDQIKKSSNNSYFHLNLNISNKVRNDIPELLIKINLIIKKINIYYDCSLPVFTEYSTIDQKILNRLHEEFEIYGERHDEAMATDGYSSTECDSWNTTRFNESFHNSWLELNSMIHIIESALVSTTEFPHFFCLVQYLPKEQEIVINDEDKLFLTTDRQWGDLYLGYDTLGKDYMHTCEDDDVRTIINNQIKIQTQFNTEVFLNFSPEEWGYREKKFFESKFWKWYSLQSEEIKKMIPINDVSKLALGRYYLGFVKYDSTFLNFHPDIKDWINGDTDLRKKWNNEVFSRVSEIVKVEIL